jgi:hypothetical protein
MKLNWLTGRSILIAVLWLVAMASVAHAHGAVAGPDELGPPVLTSVVLGIVCYWAVMLWPTRRTTDEPDLNKLVRRSYVRR